MTAKLATTVFLLTLISVATATVVGYPEANGNQPEPGRQNQPETITINKEKPEQTVLSNQKEAVPNYQPEVMPNYQRKKVYHYRNESLNHKKPVPNNSKETLPNYSKETVPNYSKETVPNYSKETVPNYSKETVPNYSKETVPNYSRETVPNYSRETVPNYSKETMANSRELVISSESNTEIEDLITVTPLPAAKPTELPVISGSSPEPCLGCAEKKKRLEEKLPAADLKKLRIKMIKNKILSKLNLRSRPKVHVSRTELPDILLKAEVLGQKVVKVTSRETDEVDATKKLLLFPNNSASNYSCGSESTNSSLCFTFQIPARSLAGGIGSGDLFVFKNGPLRSTNQNLIINEIIWTGSNGTGSKKERFLLQDDYPTRQGWLKFDMNATLQKWAEKPHLQHSFQITCKGKGCPGSLLPISVEDKHKPFLVISTGPLQTVSRRRRETVCTEGTTRCCKESLTIAFEEIGWSDWVIHPRNFTANYCRGTCETELDISRYHHSSVMQRYLTSLRARKVQPEMSLCCSPSRMTSMSIIYMTEDLTMQVMEIQNMIVQACECA